MLVVVREDLDLDVPRTLDEAFDVQGAVAECGLGVPSCGLNRGRRVFLAANDLHADAAAAR